jgi:hypothetical protein
MMILKDPPKGAGRVTGRFQCAAPTLPWIRICPLTRLSSLFDWLRASVIRLQSRHSLDHRDTCPVAVLHGTA